MLMPDVVRMKYSGNIAMKIIYDLLNSKKTAPVLKENSCDAIVVCICGEAFQRTGRVGLAEMVCENAVDLCLFQKFTVCQEILAADIFAHAFFKPSGFFVSIVNKQIAVMDEFMPKNLKNMIVGELRFIVLRYFGKICMNELLKIDLLPNIWVGTEYRLNSFV